MIDVCGTMWQSFLGVGVFKTESNMRHGTPEESGMACLGFLIYPLRIASSPSGAETTSLSESHSWIAGQGQVFRSKTSSHCSSRSHALNNLKILGVSSPMRIGSKTTARARTGLRGASKGKIIPLVTLGTCQPILKEGEVRQPQQEIRGDHRD